MFVFYKIFSIHVFRIWNAVWAAMIPLIFCAGCVVSYNGGVTKRTLEPENFRCRYVAVTGSDRNSGSRNNPFATVGKAVTDLNGEGTVFVEAGDYYLNTSVLDVSEVKNIRIVGRVQTGSSTGTPRFILGKNISGNWQKVDGCTKIWRKKEPAITGLMHWLWQHDVPDTSTAVPDDRRHILLFGRAYRLPHTRIIRTHEESDLAGALAEIEKASAPMFFYDAKSGYSYISVSGFGDPNRQTLYLSEDSFFCKSSPGAAYGLFGMSDVTILYGSIATNAFKKSQLYNVKCYGARENAFILGADSQLRNCEAGGSGSGDGLFGDGFNMHIQAVTMFAECYSHDNWDDGFSEHDDSSSFYSGCVAEYNWGSGYAPAFGARAVYRHCFSRRNAYNSIGADYRRVKRGGWDCLAYKTEQQRNGRNEASFECYNCIAEEDKIAFSDSSIAPDNLFKDMRNKRPAIGRLYNCLAIAPQLQAYRVYSITDCRVLDLGSASIKHPDTLSRQSAPVTNF